MTINIPKDDIKLLFSDFLNSFFNEMSKEHGNYYQEWINDNVRIVDHNDDECSNDFILNQLKVKCRKYGYEYIDHAFFKLKND